MIYIRTLGARGTSEHFSFVDGKRKRGGYFWFWIFFGFILLSLLLVESFARDLRNPRSQIFLFLKSLFLPSVSFVSPRRRMNYAHTHTHTHTRDIKKISLPDVDDFLICCKIITLNSIAKVLLGSHFFFFLFKILLTKTEKLG